MDHLREGSENVPTYCSTCATRGFSEYWTVWPGGHRVSTEYVDNRRVKNKTVSLKTLYPAQLIHSVNLLDRGNMTYYGLGLPGTDIGAWGVQGTSVGSDGSWWKVKGHKMTTKRHQMMREMQNKEKEKAYKMIIRFRTANILMLNDYRETKLLQINTNGLQQYLKNSLIRNHKQMQTSFTRDKHIKQIYRCWSQHKGSKWPWKPAKHPKCMKFPQQYPKNHRETK